MTTGVLLMTYGAPAGEADLPRYLAAVRGGTVASAQLVGEMARRYAAIGGSPLIERTQEQAVALERLLRTTGDFRVAGGMRFSEPSIARAAEALAAAGADRVVGICLSPQWSDLLMGGYERMLQEALAGRPDVAVTVVHAWHREPALVRAIAVRVREAVAALGVDRERTAILLTAHSLPKRVFDAEAGYLAQLRETADLVAAAAGLAPGSWQWAYQSAGHTAEEWLRPDLVELFPSIAASGRTGVLVVPVQFLSDHLEVLYDLDIAAAAQARSAGLRYRRIAMPNAQPEFIAALAEIARRFSLLA